MSRSTQNPALSYRVSPNAATLTFKIEVFRNPENLVGNYHDDVLKNNKIQILVHLTDFMAILVWGLMIFRAHFRKYALKIISPETKIAIKSVRWTKIWI